MRCRNRGKSRRRSGSRDLRADFETAKSSDLLLGPGLCRRRLVVRVAQLECALLISITPFYHDLHINDYNSPLTRSRQESLPSLNSLDFNAEMEAPSLFVYGTVSLLRPGGTIRRTTSLSSPQFTFGRLSSSDCRLLFETVSKLHARIVVDQHAPYQVIPSLVLSITRRQL